MKTSLSLCMMISRFPRRILGLELSSINQMEKMFIKEFLRFLFFTSFVHLYVESICIQVLLVFG